MTSILDTGKYSDLRITCQGRTWKVHRAVVGPASPIFAAMIDKDFEEAQSGVIDLSADEPEIVELMLRFIYEGHYNDTRPTTPLNFSDIYGRQDNDGVLKFEPSLVQCEKAMSANVKVHIIADKYKTPALEKYARMKYMQIMNQVMDTTKSIPDYRASIIFECSVRCTSSVIVSGAKGEVDVKGDKEKGNKRVKRED